MWEKKQNKGSGALQSYREGVNLIYMGVSWTVGHGSRIVDRLGACLGNNAKEDDRHP